MVDMTSDRHALYVTNPNGVRQGLHGERARLLSRGQLSSPVGCSTQIRLTRRTQRLHSPASKEFNLGQKYYYCGQGFFVRFSGGGKWLKSPLPWVLS